jgi:hypothetical protein
MTLWWNRMAFNNPFKTSWPTRFMNQSWLKHYLSFTVYIYIYTEVKTNSKS